LKNSDEVEDLLMDAMSLGIVKGKINFKE